MVSWSERMVSHTGTETLPRLLREAAVENHSHRESVTMRRRVEDEGLRVVNSCHRGIRHGHLTGACVELTRGGSHG